MRAPGACLVAALLAVFAAGCAPPVDLTKALQVNIASSGWFDAGIVDGKNKLVPSVVFTVKNVSDAKLSTLQVNALFRRVGEKDEWGSGLVTLAGSDGLPAGATSTTATVRSARGYTGTEPRAVMLANSQFVDANVELFAKSGSAQWTRLGEYSIARQLIER